METIRASTSRKEQSEGAHCIHDRFSVSAGIQNTHHAGSKLITAFRMELKAAPTPIRVVQAEQLYVFGQLYLA